MSGRLTPRERSEQRVYWGPRLDPWQVRNTRGQIVGWVVVNTPRRESGAVYHLGDAEPRPVKATTPHVTPHPEPMR